ncbi:FecR family protein [Rufibacter roseus]|uniref:FecR family protein n=1 Tax=Rufibacter roseus TaxID=1567108 RepID=A0ABW2DSQ4_9BACT|nr:FecR domain-containing protein [Rufibacter roseus]
MTQTTLNSRENPEWVLMAKALKGEMSAQEQEEFNLWLNADSNHAEQWAEALETWDEVGSIHDNSFEPDAQLAWEKVCSKANIAPIHSAPESTQQEAVVRPLFNWNHVYRYAAVFILAAGLAWVGYFNFNQSADWAQVATLSGERKTFYLPDSSQVILNSNSTLRYQTAFNGTERKVELTGEGFFDIKKNPDQPFIIESGDARTQVLGTSFNVKALENSDEVTVAVVTGKVSLSSERNGEEVILTPGYTGTLHADGKLDKTESALQSANSWKTLSFQAATVEEVTQQLSAFFGVAVETSSPELLKCTFTGTFENPKLSEILQVLAISTDMTVKQKAPNTYFLSGQGCQ